MNNVLENFKEIDITDKTILQEQFNYCRKQYFDCINSMEEVNRKISELEEDLMEITLEIYEDSSLTSAQVNMRLKSNEDYRRKKFEMECYEKSCNILQEKMNFIKTDIKILSNSMYNKF